MTGSPFMMKLAMIAGGIVIFLFWGCAGIKDPGAIKSIQAMPQPVMETDPGSVAAILENTNSGLSSFKGIGRIKIWKPDGLQSTRILWAGDPPDKLRLEILGLGGRPFSSVVYDGIRLYLSLHSESRFYQKQTRHADLSSLISMPVSVHDALSILAGRVPIMKDATMNIEKEPTGNQYVLVLQKGWFRKKTGKVYLREDLKTVWKYELFQGKDTLLYRVEYVSYKRYGDYRLPDALLFSNDLQTRIRIDIDKLWPDAELSPTAFILKPPG